jgi:predicted outer membrane repeat protein
MASGWRSRVLAGLLIVALLVLPFGARSVLASSDAKSRPERAVDPAGEAPPIDAGMSADEVAAENAEAAAEIGPEVVRTGTPIVPSTAGQSRETRVDDNRAGLTPEGERSAGDAPMSTGRVLNKPVSGMSSTAGFPDAPFSSSADTAPLPPYLQLERDTAARYRVVRFDPGLLQLALGAETVTVTLFDDVTVDLASTFAPSPGEMGSAMWGAEATPGQNLPGAASTDAAVVTFVDGGVIGQWWVDGIQYGMQPMPNGDHLVFEMTRDFPNDDPEELPAGPDNGPRSEGLGGNDAAADVQASPTVDVMIAYDAEAFAFYGSNAQTVRNNAIAMVNLSNVVYINSDPVDALQNLTLTHVYATGATPNTNNIQTYRNQLASKTDGNFDGIHASRDANASDLVALLSNRFSADACGIAFFPTSANPSENDAYSVTEASCALGNLSFTHELGHNQCAGHDPGNGASGCIATYPYAQGFLDCAAGKRTIMAYPACGAVRLPVFSNPGNTFNGWVTGTATQDNQAVLEAEDRAPGTLSGGVADYRTFVRGDVAVAGVDGVSCVFRTIEDALVNAAPGSTIYISPGTHAGFTADLNYNINKDLTLSRGTSRCGPTTGGSATDVILTPAAGSTVDAVLEASGAGTEVRLDRITVQGGTGAEGTVQVFSGSTVTLDNAVVRNGINATSNGGGVRVLNGGTLIGSNNFQIENNRAVNGGGIYVDGGTVNLNGLGDVDLNTATSNGGGIYAINGATVILTNDADVLQNTAVNGGGLYLDNASATATGLQTNIGFAGSGNTATTGGGGVFATNGATVTVGSSAAVYGNTANSFAGGIRTIANATARIDAGGDVVANTVTGSIGGGGFYSSAPSTVDLNPGSEVSGNVATTGRGGGFVIFGTLDADGGTGPVSPVLISGNTAATQGGGIYSAGTSDLDTVRVQNNRATQSGGGAFVTSGTFSVLENFDCDLADLGSDQYCNEFRGNSIVAADGTGAAISANGGSVTVQKTGFIGNTSAEAAVILATGATIVELRSIMAFSNVETALNSNESLVTLKSTASLNMVAATFANHTETFLDTDGSATATTSRVLTTTSTESLVTTPGGGCNMGPAGANLPGLIAAVPVFAVDPTYPNKPTYAADNKSAYLPASGSAARDACTTMGGLSTDARDTGQLNGSGAVNVDLDWDIGGLEAPK